MIPTIVDSSGLNRISRGVFTRAAGAVCGMVESSVPPGEDKPTIVASMFGNTTPCVEAGRAILEKAGFEVLVFHATGSGGQTMESLIEARQVAGVLDVTTTEWADELVGGVMSAGPQRLEAAARTGTPAVIAPGASTWSISGALRRSPNVSQAGGCIGTTRSRLSSAPRRRRMRSWAASLRAS